MDCPILTDDSGRSCAREAAPSLHPKESRVDRVVMIVTVLSAILALIFAAVAYLNARRG